MAFNKTVKKKKCSISWPDWWLDTHTHTHTRVCMYVFVCVHVYPSYCTLKICVTSQQKINIRNYYKKTHCQKFNLPKDSSSIHGLSHSHPLPNRWWQILRSRNKVPRLPVGCIKEGWKIPAENNQFLKTHKLFPAMKSYWPLPSRLSQAGWGTDARWDTGTHT